MGYLFGPVYSRRLGRSLGVDLVPHKICNFDCLYCECGKTTSKVDRRGKFVKVDRLLQEFEKYLSDYGEEGFDVVTLTGSGETTLEIQLMSIIQEIRKRTQKPIAVLTNGSLMSEAEVQQSLSLADIVLPSLDAVSPQVFRKLDQPLPRINIDQIILGMIDFRKKYSNVQFWLEILIAAGINDSNEEIQKIKSAVDAINPHQVHVMTVTRPPAYPDCKAVSEEKLQQIKAILWPKMLEMDLERDSKTSDQAQNITYERILEIVKRRPCPLKELVLVFGIDASQLQNILMSFVKQGLLVTLKHHEDIFFAAPSTKN